MKHTFIYNKANRTKNESGITRSRTHLFNIVKPYSVVKRMAVIIMTAIMIYARQVVEHREVTERLYRAVQLHQRRKRAM